MTASDQPEQTESPAPEGFSASAAGSETQQPKTPTPASGPAVPPGTGLPGRGAPRGRGEREPRRRERRPGAW